MYIHKINIHTQSYLVKILPLLKDLAYLLYYYFQHVVIHDLGLLGDKYNGSTFCMIISNM